VSVVVVDTPAPPYLGHPRPPAERPYRRHHLRHLRRADQVDPRPPLGVRAAWRRCGPSSPRSSSSPTASASPPARARSRHTPNSAADHARPTTPGSPPAALAVAYRWPRSTSRTTPTSPSTRVSNSSTEDSRRGMSRGTNQSPQEAARDTTREHKAQVGRQKASATTTSTGLRRWERRFESCRGHTAGGTLPGAHCPSHQA
jgi:hypothetical protein